MNRAHPLAWVMLAILTTGCDEELPQGIPLPADCPGGPCDVRGVDLVLDSVALVDAEAPLELAPGDTLLVRWQVFNRGDRTSAPTELHIDAGFAVSDPADFSAELSALTPGERLTDTIPLVIPQPGILRRNLGYGFEIPLTVRLVDREADSFFDNNEAALPSFTYLAPDLHGAIRPLGANMDETGRYIVHVNDTVQWEITMENTGLGPSSETALLACIYIWPADSGCHGTQYTFGMLTSVAPGEVVVDTLTFALHLEMLPYEGEAWRGLDAGGLFACVPDPSGQARWTGLCLGLASLNIPPAFLTECEIGVAAPGTPLTDAGIADCSLLTTDPRDVWALEAEAGVSYGISAPGTSIDVLIASGWDPGQSYDGAVFTPDESGTYYITITGEGYSLTVTTG